jgi:hypothetical protein
MSTTLFDLREAFLLTLLLIGGRREFIYTISLSRRLGHFVSTSDSIFSANAKT